MIIGIGMSDPFTVGVITLCMMLFLIFLGVQGGFCCRHRRAFGTR